MRLLADENFPGPAVHALRALGHDVVWITEIAPRELDVDVLARARREGRTLVTLDKDFGELAFRARLPAACGVVLFRLRRPWPTVVAAVATAMHYGRRLALGVGEAGQPSHDSKWTKRSEVHAGRRAQP